MADDLSISVNGATFSRWTGISLTRSIDQIPSHFDISATDRYPGNPYDVIAKPGDPCSISIGGDLVLTGYVDRCTYNYAPGQHTISISGRSKLADVVDCSAWIPGPTSAGITQIANVSVVALISALCAVVNVPVVYAGSHNPIIPSYVITLGTTIGEIVDTCCKFAGLLYYDQPDGSLLLTDLATTSMASGFSQGQNIQSAAVTYSMDQRFSEYRAVWSTTDGMTDTAPSSLNQRAVAYDEGVGRTRIHYLIVEQFLDTADLGMLRANWEANRRWGRSQAVTVTVDSWRDGGGTLWQPNALALVDIPSLKVSGQIWCIGSVTYNRAIGSGTTATVTLMPKEAFAPEPTALFDQQVDVHTANVAAGNGGSQ
jgi:prophage tail gpP-like protein